MKHIMAVSITLVALGCADAPTSPRALATEAPSLATVTTTTNTITPVDTDVFVECADGGAGEWVHLEGELHTVIHATFTNSGNWLLKRHLQPQGVVGYGQVTGDKYQGTGVIQEVEVVKDPLPHIYTYVNSLRMIGQGPGNNFLMHQVVHVTINANGEITALVDDLRAECK